MWVMVSLTFSFVGFLWFNSTAKQFVALLNPGEVQQDTRNLADKSNNKTEKPFATILDSFKGLTANISELFSFKQSGSLEITNSLSNTKPVEPQKLPLSGNK